MKKLLNRNNVSRAAVFVSLILFLLAGPLQQSFAQDNSCRLRISLLTCAPGEELYSIFGHTALRVQDSSSGTDQVFNYGTFEFEPGFYMKFIRGKLLYSLSVEEFEAFLYTYRVESRSVVEQELLLNCTQKMQLYTALLINAREENRHYRYDFLFDNCTTRAKDMVKQHSGLRVAFKDILDGERPSFRDLIHSYLDAGNQHWSKLGIDILLGARLDRDVTNEESMFLPDYLLKGFDSAVVNGNRKLVLPPAPVLVMPSPLGEGFFITPFMAFGLLFLSIFLISFSRSGRWNRFVLKFDRFFFFLLGLAGLLLLFMWFGTDHRVARDNFNLAWALPPHVVMAFFAGRRSRGVRRYFFFTFLLAIVLLITWFLLPQEMNPALIPLVLLVAWRSWTISKRK